MKRLSTKAYVQGVRDFDRATFARAITLIESQKPADLAQAQEVLAALLPDHQKRAPAIRLGISGVPGAGKSTFIEALGCYLVAQGQRVAVLAVDPSSTLSGGSILGDKSRMQKLAQEESAFIRPSPSATTLGGVARKTREVMLLCEAAGFDTVLVETVGVGQSEVAVAKMVDTFAVLMLPGAGDEIQGIKRGIVELADIIAVNKADGDRLKAARIAQAEYTSATKYLLPKRGSWRAKVMCLSALENRGIEDFWQAVMAHRQDLESAGDFESLRASQLEEWMWQEVFENFERAIHGDAHIKAMLPALLDEVRAGQKPPTQAAHQLMEVFRRS